MHYFKFVVCYTMFVCGFLMSFDILRRIDGNGLQSTLYIDGVLAADFDGQYTCWMRNKHALLDPARKLSIRRHCKFELCL